MDLNPQQGNANEPARYFVWVSLNGIPSPQKWYDDMTTGHGTFRYGETNPISGPLFAFHALTPDQGFLTISELSALFPFERRVD